MSRLPNQRPMGRPICVPADDSDAVYEVFRLSIERARHYLPMHRIPMKNGKAKYIYVVTECEDVLKSLPLEPFQFPPER